MSVQSILIRAKEASPSLAAASTDAKNAALARIAQLLLDNSNAIVSANAMDLERGKENGLSQGLLDRLKLDEVRIQGLERSIEEIIALPDPVGVSVQGKTLPNGISLQQVKVPFGVIGCIYEARPNVTVDIAALALKSGNAAMLRGGSAAEKTNEVLVSLIQRGLKESSLPESGVATVDEFGRDGAKEMMQARGLIDVLIPRGSAALIQSVVQNSKVPVIETGDGIVHMFLDESADLDMALPLVINSKTHRPSVCNALETLLVHASAAERLLPAIGKALVEAGVKLHGCEISRKYIEAEPATDETWKTEYLSLELSVRVVDDLDAALEHIAKFSTQHTESIVTGDLANAERFLASVDSAAVMVNTSTRFTDGGEFGFGAEVGISTQKLHARGPMGLSELTSTKWLIRGNGQVRS
jgi:glutamate-5-semialdehyde dehydrogenase